MANVSKKIGRNAAKCAAYEARGTREKNNRLRKLRHERRQEKAWLRADRRYWSQFDRAA